jgi:uncharacterized membrane protein
MGETYARINNRGQVAGIYLSDEPTGSPLSRVFLWDRSKGLTDLGDLGGYNIFLDDINDRGQIVATDFRQDLEPLLFFWSRGVRTDIGVLSSPPTSGSVDLNNRGQVVFTGSGATGRDQAYLWERGALTALGNLGRPLPFPSTARAINERSEVTGSTGGLGYIWRRGVLTPLDALVSDNASQASDINDNGLVTGISANDFELHTVIWHTH